MGVSFYMSRVVLQILGIEDLGIYNVVGGIVTMMSFMNSSLNITTQRFLNYEMGKGRLENLSKVFSMSYWSYTIIAAIVLLVCETIGLWFFYNYLNIPENRLDAAFWVYQFSVLSFVINLLTVPYTSTIIAHERMGIYAYISIGDAILKLGLVFALNYINYDKLWLYGFMMLLVTLFIWICNWIYCRMQFEECKLRLMWDNDLFKKLLSFSGWNAFGAVASSVDNQGVNILINMFFNPSLNGARAIAYQVRIAVNSFAANFLTAVRPQLFKSYAEGRLDYMYKLIYSSSKFSIYLLLIFILPLLFNTEFVLNLWLGEVTPAMVTFTQLVLIGIPINTCFPTLANVSQATGKVKWYQIGASVVFLMIPISTYVLYKLGFGVEWAFIMAIVFDIIGLVVRLLMLKIDMQFPIMTYLRKVIYPVLIITFLAVAILIYPLSILNISGWMFLFVSTMSFTVVIVVLIWSLGMENYEKKLINAYIIGLIKKCNK